MIDGNDDIEKWYLLISIIIKNYYHKPTEISICTVVANFYIRIRMFKLLSNFVETEQVAVNGYSLFSTQRTKNPVSCAHQFIHYDSHSNC